MEDTKLKDGILVTDKGFLRRDIILRDGLIDLSSESCDCKKTIDIKDKYVLPGFVDIHFHGLNLFDFTLGQFHPDTDKFDDSPQAYKIGFQMLSKSLLAFGVTGFYLATFAASTKVLKNCCLNLANYLKKDQQETPSGARLFGALLEGSFINPDMAGAQSTKHLFDFSSKAFDDIEDGGVIKLANVVPDQGQKSIDLIKHLCQKGIVVGAGHTNATCDQFFEAIKAGLKYCIHFTNGPTGGSYKPFNGGGAIEAVLKFDEVYAELIADGYHINPAYIRDIIKRKGIEKIIGITDTLFACGSTLKEFTVGGVKGRVSPDGKYMSVVGKQNALFSSNLTMLQGFENMLNWLSSDMDGIWNSQHQALDFEEAVRAVAMIYSTNPCNLAGLGADGFGRIENGAKADICVLDIQGSSGNYKAKVEKTIVNGDILYSGN